MKKTLFVLTALLGVALQTQAYDIRSGLVSYYTFDVSTTADSAFTNHLTPIAAPVLVTTNPAPRASALQLNGTSQYLRVDHPTDNSINGLPVYKAGAYTVMMWVKGVAQANRYIFTDAEPLNVAGKQPLFLMQSGAAANISKLDVLIRNDTPTTFINHAVSSNVVFDNTWHHVAFVDDRGTVQIYVDGNLDGNSSLFNHASSGVFSFDRMAIGALGRTTAAGFFNGSLDEVAVWERALSQSEVQQIMANGIVTPVPVLPAAIISQPASSTNNLRDNVTFSVSASGTVPNSAVTYQWFSNNVAVLDATNRTFRIFGVTTNDTGKTFRVGVSNAIGGEMSANAILTVLPDGLVDLRNQLVSYWPLDAVTNDGVIISTIDLYSRNDLRLTNLTEADLVAGQFSNALHFDNLLNTYAVRAGGSAIYTTNSTGYSVSLWVRADGTFQADARVYSEASTAGANPVFTIGTANPVSPTGAARIFIRNDANVIILDRLSTRTVFEAGGATWHHLVWTDNAGKGRLYIDGVLDETDFTYTPSAVTLNVSSVGAVVRTTAGNIVFGDIDEVAVWSRNLSFTDVQDVKNFSVPLPLAPTPPGITTQPGSTNVFPGTTVTLSVVASGTGPFSYQWIYDAAPVSNATNASLVITNIQAVNAGNYFVTIVGAAGTTNSASATVTVTPRPAPPASLAIEFNDRPNLPTTQQPGFVSFTLDGSGATTLQTTRLFGGVEVTVGGSNGTTADSRNRATPVNLGDFTEEKLLQDFVFSPPTTGTEGLDVTVKFLASNKVYNATIWSYDQINPGPRVSDWYANGILVKDDYVFDGTIAPTNNLQYQFSFPVTSDSEGKIVFQGRREATGTGVSVFLNALRIALPVTRISSVEITGGNVRLTVETPDSSTVHSVQKTDNLSPVSWGPVSGVTATVLSPTSMRLEFAQPLNSMQFYRVNRAE